jgi:hypothetical protein|tara:strand:+ start:29 stop:1048 length:1020 start_codon:yes stop_codon:yes gene_type:complete
MPFQKVEFEFPDGEDTNTDIEIEPTGAIEVDISGKKPEAPPKRKEEEEEDNNDLEIEVVDDVPKSDRNRKPSEPPAEVTDEELEDYSEKVRNRIKHFSKGYHDERRAKEQATRERQELEKYAKSLIDENNKLKGTVDKNQAALIEQAKKNTAGEMLVAKRAYKDAYESGDADKLLEAQEKLTAANLKADKLKNFKSPTLQDNETAVQQEPTSTVSETSHSVDQRASEWAQANPWFGPSNPEMTGYAMGLHQKLVESEGVDPSSNEYYERIDSRMRELFPEQFDEVVKPKRRSNVVAPATRSMSSKKVTLKKSEVAIAKRLGVPLEEYARNVAALNMRSN